MIIYKGKDNDKKIDYIQCDQCKALCNKFGKMESIHITFPVSQPDFEKLNEEDRLIGKDFCCHKCAMDFLEHCQKMIFRLNMRKLIEQDG